METFKFVMEGIDFTVPVQITKNDTEDLRKVVSDLVNKIKLLLDESGRKILDKADKDNEVTIKLKCLKLPELKFKLVESFSDLKAQKKYFEEEKIESALYFDYSIDYPIKFDVKYKNKTYYQPTKNHTQIYSIRLFAGNCIKFFPSTETHPSFAAKDEVKPFGKQSFLRWSILSPRTSIGSYAKQKNEVYNSIVHAWKFVNDIWEGTLVFDSLFMEQMGEIQELMKEKDQAVFQRVGTTVTKRVTKLENIFNDMVFDNLSISFKDLEKQILFLRMIDKYLGNIEYQETEGSVRAEVRQMLGRREDLQLVKYNEPRNPSASIEDTVSSDIVSGDAGASGTRGGYRELPKRKKRRDTKRKKRKNTKRKKRKNTKRKNTKRKNTKKR